jgi:hypothetical protein
MHRGIDYHISTIVLLDFGSVPTVVFFIFILLLPKKRHNSYFTQTDFYEQGFSLNKK